MRSDFVGVFDVYLLVLGMITRILDYALSYLMYGSSRCEKVQ